MAKNNFDRCLPEILRHEGLWADHPDDPGGATMKGITIGTYAQWKGRKVTKDELRRITDAEVAAIYRRNYWDKVRGDDLPSGLDLVAFDAAVNSGPSRGARWLQQALGVTADGAIGPATLAAARKQYAPAVIERAVGARLAFLKSLKTWKTFGKGWSRRVEGVRSVALSMVEALPIDIPDHQADTPAKPGFLAALIAFLTSIFGGRK
jgi:lysozyme family protein